MTNHLWFLNNLAQVHVNEPTLSIVELSGAPGDTPPLHVHHDEDEVFHVLEGELTVHVAGAEPIVLRAGDAAFAPRGVPHVYVVTSETRARWIGTTTGPQFASFVAELSTPAAAPTLPEAPDIDPAQVAAVAASHRIDLLGPPGTLPRELEGAAAS
jgi:mannose-6-phosphate isomerase-like protein (cupin superfamily)